MKKILFTILLTIIYSNAFAQVVDTLKIKSGVPYAFLINIAEYPTQIVGDNLEKEKDELENNFREQGLKVVLIKKHCFLQLESGEGLDMTHVENPYKATAYWSGVVYDEIQIFDRITKTTEFVAEKMGVNVKSSYAKEAALITKEVKSLTSAKNITNKSKITLSKYMLQFQNLNSIASDYDWYIQEIPKIKNLKVLFTENGKEEIYQNFAFNKLGQITSQAKTENNSMKTYSYQNNMLVKIKSESSEIVITYNDDKMILSEDLGGATETSVLWVEENVLLLKRYIVMKDAAYATQNMIIEQKIEGSEIITYLNGKISNRLYSSPHGIFPMTYSNTSYQDDGPNKDPIILQSRKFRIEKKDDGVFEQYSSTVLNPDDKDKFELDSTFYTNENNAIYRKTNLNNTFKIEYSYY